MEIIYECPICEIPFGTNEQLMDHCYNHHADIMPQNLKEG